MNTYPVTKRGFYYFIIRHGVMQGLMDRQRYLRFGGLPGVEYGPYPLLTGSRKERRLLTKGYVNAFPEWAAM